MTFCDILWHDIERKRRLVQHSKTNKLIYDSIVHTKARFKWHLCYTLIRNEYLKFLRKHALLAAGNSRGIVSSTTAAAVLFTSNNNKPSYNEKLTHSEAHSSILLYDRPIMRSAPVPAKRSGYRYNFDYEQTSDLRFIYQQLKSLTSNVAQLKNNNDHHHREDPDDEEIYLPPNHLVTQKPQSHVTCTFPDQTSQQFHNIPTMQRR